MYDDRWIGFSLALVWVVVILFIAVNLIQDHSINDRIVIPDNCNAGDVIMYDEHHEFACVSFDAWAETKGVF